MSQKVEETVLDGELLFKMATDMAHELRTPLGGIIGMNELLLTSELDSEQKLFSETVNDSAKSMLQLLTDFVELARLRANKVVAQPAPFQLDVVLDEVAYALKRFLKLNQIELKINFADSAPKKMVNDETCFRQAITAIVTGSAKFIESGVIAIDIAGGGSDSAHVTITLPSNTVNRNGQPLFTQLAHPNAPIQRYDATWLRLSIAQKLLELLSAKYSVDGNCLEFELPQTK